MTKRLTPAERLPPDRSFGYPILVKLFKDGKPREWSRHKNEENAEESYRQAIKHNPGCRVEMVDEGGRYPRIVTDNNLPVQRPA